MQFTLMLLWFKWHDIWKCLIIWLHGVAHKSRLSNIQMHSLQMRWKNTHGILCGPPRAYSNVGTERKKWENGRGPKEGTTAWAGRCSVSPLNTWPQWLLLSYEQRIILLPLRAKTHQLSRVAGCQHRGDSAREKERRVPRSPSALIRTTLDLEEGDLRDQNSSGSNFHQPPRR